MAKKTKEEIVQDIAIGAAAGAAGGVAATLTLGVIGSVITVNPAPFLAALHIVPHAAAHGAVGGAGGNS